VTVGIRAALTFLHNREPRHEEELKVARKKGQKQRMKNRVHRSNSILYSLQGFLPVLA